MGADNDHTVTIVVATTIPSIVLITLLGILCFRFRRQRSRLFRRGVSPIDDEEIESWKGDNSHEKGPASEPDTIDRYTHRRHGSSTDGGIRYSIRDGRQQHYHQHDSSIGSLVQKPASVIVYQSRPSGDGRPSEDLSPHSIGSGKRSLEMLQSPVLARAPNSRPGLTDDTVQGDDAFIAMRRNHSRLSKTPPTSPRHARSKSLRREYQGASGQGEDRWYGRPVELIVSPRHSHETFPGPSPISPQTPTRTHKHAYTHSTPEPVISYDEEYFLGGLSPRPRIHKSEIGRAIG